MTSTARVSLLPLIAASLLALVACGETPQPEATPTSAVSTPTATTTPTASASPTASAAPPAFELTCESVVPAARRDSFAASGLSLTPSADFFAKVASEGHPSPFNLFQANGGVVCPWGNGSEVVAVYGATPLPEGQAEAMKSLILDSDPYTESSYVGGTLFTSQMDGNPFTLFLVVETAAYVATSQEILDELLITIP